MVICKFETNKYLSLHLIKLLITTKCGIVLNNLEHDYEYLPTFSLSWPLLQLSDEGAQGGFETLSNE